MFRVPDSDSDDEAPSFQNKGVSRAEGVELGNNTAQMPTIAGIPLSSGQELPEATDSNTAEDRDDMQSQAKDVRELKELVIKSFNDQRKKPVKSTTEAVSDLLKQVVHELKQLNGTNGTIVELLKKDGAENPSAAEILSLKSSHPNGASNTDIVQNKKECLEQTAQANANATTEPTEAPFSAPSAPSGGPGMIQTSARTGGGISAGWLDRRHEKVARLEQENEALNNSATEEMANLKEKCKNTLKEKEAEIALKDQRIAELEELQNKAQGALEEFQKLCKEKDGQLAVKDDQLVKANASRNSLMEELALAKAELEQAKQMPTTPQVPDPEDCRHELRNFFERNAWAKKVIEVGIESGIDEIQNMVVAERRSRSSFGAQLQPTPGTGNFGAASQQPTRKSASGFGGGLFGAVPKSPSFGNTAEPATNTPSTSGGLFGGGRRPHLPTAAGGLLKNTASINPFNDVAARTSTTNGGAFGSHPSATDKPTSPFSLPDVGASSSAGFGRASSSGGFGSSSGGFGGGSVFGARAPSQGPSFGGFGSLSAQPTSASFGAMVSTGPAATSAPIHVFGASSWHPKPFSSTLTSAAPRPTESSSGNGPAFGVVRPAPGIYPAERKAQVEDGDEGAL